MTNPTLVIVHGASHTGEHFVPLANALQAAGFTNVCNPHTAAGSKPAVTSFDPDAAHIRDTVTKCVDSGEDVAAIMHSYGGAPSCEAVGGLSKEDRAKEGKTGGVTRMIFITSLVLPEGTTVQNNPEQVAKLKILKEGFGTVLDGKEWFYNDMSDEEAATWSAKMVPQAVGVMMSPLTYPAYFHIPSLYLLCEKDNGLPFASQRRMVEFAGIEDTLTLDSGHSPYLSRIDETVGFISRAVGKV
ncbi:alpha/beta-hydrolase [Cenococcum geophilum 1.58]|uniref:alpha/beta-hydrolase n=1 Tax=Cenococcum geophilum 1.58 TaxID=794803 RepID=UPI00358F88C7|nr:alpha/beta-hydrolase [Cenococcum geophilum 1.58]